MLILFLIILVLFTMLLYYDIRKPNNFPPGPTWYPIIGSALKIAQERTHTGMLCTAITKISAKYGKSGVLGLKIGKDKAVICNDTESIKEMSLNEDFDGRPKGPFYETRTWGERYGLILTDEELWSDHRRFVVRHLKEFGFARRGMLDICQNEAEHLLEDFKYIVDNQNGKAMIKMQDAFSVYTLNTLWTMMAGIRYSRDEPELKQLQGLLHTLFTNIDMMGCLFSHFPLLRYIAPEYSGYNPFIKVHSMMFDFLGKEVEKHKQQLRMENEPRDFMDVYLQVLQNSKKKKNFSEKQLLAVCFDMFLAGSETTTKSLGTAYLNIIRNPLVQKKLQEEIDSVVSRHRLPLIEDRTNMPYCEAIILETLRLFMGHTFGIPHRALRDTKLRGFDIPKDTMVIGNFHGMLLDETLWDDAHTFRPERFIRNGKTFVPEHFHPFGLGKHRCMGEIMAKSNLFLFITTLFQNFNFLIPDGHPLPSAALLDGATPSVRQYTVMVQYR